MATQTVEKPDLEAQLAAARAEFKEAVAAERQLDAELEGGDLLSRLRARRRQGDVRDRRELAQLRVLQAEHELTNDVEAARVAARGPALRRYVAELRQLRTTLGPALEARNRCAAAWERVDAPGARVDAPVLGHLNEDCLDRLDRLIADLDRA